MFFFFLGPIVYNTRKRELCQTAVIFFARAGKILSGKDHNIFVQFLILLLWTSIFGCHQKSIPLGWLVSHHRAIPIFLEVGLPCWNSGVGVQTTNGQLRQAEECWQALFGDLFLYCCFRRISSLSLQLLTHISTRTVFPDTLFCTRMLGGEAEFLEWVSLEVYKAILVN